MEHVSGLPAGMPWWLAAVTMGAVIGAWLGIKHLAPSLLRYLLAALLLTGGLWMLWIS
jgi:uncharacterized membrane protein YfcA